MYRICFSILAAALTVTECIAQEINVDFGTEVTGAITSDFAAAGQGGFWNSVGLNPSGIRTKYSLQDTNDIATDVSLQVAGTTTLVKSASRFGNDARRLLLDGVQAEAGGSVTVEFNGLEPGFYEVIVYGMSGDRRNQDSSLEVSIQHSPPIRITGRFDNEFEQGESHELFEGVVHDGSLTVDVRAFNRRTIILSGIQIHRVTIHARQLTGDLTGDSVVNTDDIDEFMTVWEDGHGCDGRGSCPADLTGDAEIDVFDLLELLAIISSQ